MEAFEYSSEETDSDSSDNWENEDVNHHNVSYTQVAGNKQMRLIQESKLTFLIIDQK